MAVHPLRPATRRRLGRPLPHQQADRPRAHPIPQKLSTNTPTCRSYPVLDPVSQAYPEVQGRSPTCYSPVRHSSTSASTGLSVRLACVKHAASVHPEPGSNSPQKSFNTKAKQAVKSPKPNKKQTNHHTQHAMNWQSKNYCNQPPHPTGHNRRLAKNSSQRNIHPPCTTQKRHVKQHPIIGSDTTHRHAPPPPTKSSQAHTAHNQTNTTMNTNKKCLNWHTIEFSNNTRTPPHPTHTQAKHEKRLEQHYTTTPTKSKPGTSASKLDCFMSRQQSFS